MEPFCYIEPLISSFTLHCHSSDYALHGYGEQVMQTRKEDWHPADIIAALRKRGTSLAALSRASGLCSSTLANALSRPWPKGEWLIAMALEVHPAEIWPSRYYDPDTLLLLDRKKRIRSPDSLKKIPEKK
jgi:Ner family transcriptional regulator